MVQGRVPPPDMELTRFIAYEPDPRTGATRYEIIVVNADRKTAALPTARELTQLDILRKSPKVSAQVLALAKQIELVERGKTRPPPANMADAFDQFTKRR